MTSYETSTRPGAQVPDDTPHAPGTARTALVQDPVERNSAASTDRVHWGPVWAGTLVALPVFLVLQLLFFSLSWLDLGNQGEGQGTTTSIVSAVLALVAFFVGGLMAGSATAVRDADAGLRHGVLVWALTVVAILGVTLLGGGALVGTLGSAATQAGTAQQLAQPPAIDPAAALQAAHHGAGWAALGLGLTVLAAAFGGLTGAKGGSRRTSR